MGVGGGGGVVVMSAREWVVGGCWTGFRAGFSGQWRSGKRYGISAQRSRKQRPFPTCMSSILLSYGHGNLRFQLLVTGDI